MRKISHVVASLGVACVVLLGAVGTVSAADEWFVLSEQALKAADPSVEIKSSGGRWDKDVKQVRFSVEGGDVDITKAVLHWDNRPDDTITDAGVLKAGGQTAPKNAPGRKDASPACQSRTRFSVVPRRSRSGDTTELTWPRLDLSDTPTTSPLDDTDVGWIRVRWIAVVREFRAFCEGQQARRGVHLKDARDCRAASDLRAYVVVVQAEHATWDDGVTGGVQSGRKRSVGTRGGRLVRSDCAGHCSCRFKAAGAGRHCAGSGCAYADTAAAVVSTLPS